MPKYFWGDNPLDDRLLGFAQLWTGVSLSAYLTFVVGPAGGAPGIDSGMSLDSVKPAVFATLAWCLIYYNGMGVQVWTRLLKNNVSKGATDATGRIMANTMEHAPSFLCLMWLHCAYVNSTEAGYIGLYYVAHRTVYQCFYGVRHLRVAKECYFRS